MMKGKSTHTLIQTLTLFLLLALIFIFWHNFLIYPLKVLVVFFHESSHALMTVATGGEVTELVVERYQGGHVLSRGGSRFWVLTAGYLGSLLWGVVIYLAAARSRLDKAVMIILGVLVIGICFLFVRNLYGFVFSLLMGLAMLGIGALAGERVNDFVLKLIGLTSMVYVPLDIYSDTISRSHLRSDAFMLAQEFGGTTMMWGGLWMLISGGIILVTLYLGFKGPDRVEAEKRSSEVSV